MVWILICVTFFIFRRWRNIIIPDFTENGNDSFGISSIRRFVHVNAGRDIAIVEQAIASPIGTGKAVCEEALSNIRTVRSCACEYSEVEMFRAETNAAAELSEKLGTGIAVFQALTNLFLNGCGWFTYPNGPYHPNYFSGHFCNFIENFYFSNLFLNI